jgi:site-specific DNA-cytosine methylase
MRCLTHLQDMFSGIGSGLVSLKRLGIKIRKVIHVEHDKVATHVYKTNHDSHYNTELARDGIEHVYYSTFEEVEKDLCGVFREHGRK